ncbi:hypothetical protein [Methylocystis heyeri]|uniref:Uncharacterized protein n=1 Tax=Methylocystis heyeri TaxID=391905 RepID=A0A6B8KH53_9HYPH|nr:hypothetical protein [Methylocystis heyeri]QGM45770.1 hypothetical protein H2LOC_008680 [Methylocystis heyeri]
MESFSQWFQDWAEACSYAQECVPDLPPVFPHAQEPWTALGAVAALCLFLWWANERSLKKLLAQEARWAGIKEDAAYPPASQPLGQLGAMFDAAAKGLRLSASRKAAA